MKTMTRKLMMMAMMLLLSMMMVMPAHAAKAKLNLKNANLTAGETVQLKVKGKKKKANWKSSNKKVATVSRKGLVTAKAPGSAKISVKIGGRKLTCKVNVTAARSGRRDANDDDDDDDDVVGTPGRGGNGSPSADNEFYNPSNFQELIDCINITPYHMYYKNGCLYADCYVINGFAHYVYNISVDSLKFSNPSGLIASSYFGILRKDGRNICIRPRSYVTWTFVFRSGTFKNNAVLNGRIICDAETSNTY